MAGPAWQDSDLMFTTRIGTALDRSEVTKEFQRVLNEAGLPHFKLRDLRTSCATLLGRLKVEPAVGALILGHSDPSITLRYYTRAVPDSVTDAGSVMDRFLEASDTGSDLTAPDVLGAESG